MKKVYEKPTIEIIVFEVEDSITSSALFNGGENGITDEFFWGDIQ